MNMKRSLFFHALRYSMPLAVFIVLGCIVILCVTLLAKGITTINLELFFGDTPPLKAILGQLPVWEGIWPALLGTLYLILLTMGIAFFPGIGCGVFLAEYASPHWKRRVGTAIDLLSGTPSIVMGLFGFTLILFLRRTLMPEANTCLLLAAGCLSLLVMPVLVVNTREALEAVPLSTKLAARGLGFSKNQIIFHISLPMGMRGILSGVILGIGRSAEDTAVIMLTGAVANAGLPSGLFAKFEALPFTIYYTIAQYQTQEELALAFGTALLLLLFAGCMVLLAKYFEQRHMRRWKGGIS